MGADNESEGADGVRARQSKERAETRQVKESGRGQAGRAISQKCDYRL